MNWITTKQKHRHYGRACMALGFLSAVFVLSCSKGNEGIKAPKARDNADLEEAGGKKTSKKCVDAVNCPKLELSLRGPSKLIGSADRLLTWDVSGITPEDKSRKVLVAMDGGVPGMQIISEINAPTVSANWRPDTPQQGYLRFRARDLSRCSMIMGSEASCANMQNPTPEYDLIIETPFEIAPKGQTIDPKHSEFFRQFHCKRHADKISKLEKAIGAAGGIAAGAAAGAAAEAARAQKDFQDRDAQVNELQAEYSKLLNERRSKANATQDQEERQAIIEEYDKRLKANKEAMQAILDSNVGDADYYKGALGGAEKGADEISGGLDKGIAVIVDYLVNGEERQTAYDCLKSKGIGQSSTQEVEAPADSQEVEAPADSQEASPQYE